MAPSQTSAQPQRTRCLYTAVKRFTCSLLHCHVDQEVPDHSHKPPLVVRLYYSFRRQTVVVKDDLVKFRISVPYSINHQNRRLDLNGGLHAGQLKQSRFGAEYTSRRIREHSVVFLRTYAISTRTLAAFHALPTRKERESHRTARRKGKTVRQKLCTRSPLFEALKPRMINGYTKARSSWAQKIFPPVCGKLNSQSDHLMEYSDYRR